MSESLKANSNAALSGNSTVNGVSGNDIHHVTLTSGHMSIALFDRNHQFVIAVKFNDGTTLGGFLNAGQLADLFLGKSHEKKLH